MQQELLSYRQADWSSLEQFDLCDIGPKESRKRSAICTDVNLDENHGPTSQCTVHSSFETVLHYFWIEVKLAKYIYKLICIYLLDIL